MKLLIVESPTKSKKLRQFLSGDYRIAASFGHVRDLPRSGGLGVTFAEGRVTPSYQTIERAGKAVRELRQLAGQAEEILLATDPDREGEAIAWHVAEILGDAKPCRRVTFNAITRKAVLDAVASPRELDAGLIGAQQARRVLDRVVGWLVSPTLSRGLRDKAARSAGRVQSVALRIVAEREREIGAFTAVDYFVLEATLAKRDCPPSFQARLVEWKGEPLGHRLAEAATAEATVAWCQRQPWTVLAMDSREAARNPPPPFVTATVQQAASVRLKFTPKRTMELLQHLFENGHITYHRTDSVAVAPEAIAEARRVIADRFPQDYLPAQPVQHAGKTANAQEAHEAIRPTHPEHDQVASGDAATLYRLIWERFIASQMASGRDHLSTIRIAVAKDAFEHPERGTLPMGVFEAKGKIVRFDGWRRLTDDTTDEAKKGRAGKGRGKPEEAAVLPQVSRGDPLELEDLRASKKTTKAPARYTQASLIKKLEAEGVGRPSTYANILSTILDRGYVDERQRKLHATELGLKVTDFLVAKFGGNFIDVDFTARMETSLDRIAAGEEDWQQVVTQASFHVRDLARAAGLGHDPLSGEERPDPSAPDPEAPPCPKCGGAMARRLGRYGAFFGCLQRECKGACNLDGSVGRKRSGPATSSTDSAPAPLPADPDAPPCPDCGAATAAGNANDGAAIWSCTRFPSCGGQLPRA